MFETFWRYHHMLLVNGVYVAYPQPIDKDTPVPLDVMTSGLGALAFMFAGNQTLSNALLVAPHHATHIRFLVGEDGDEHTAWCPIERAGELCRSEVVFQCAQRPQIESLYKHVFGRTRREIILNTGWDEDEAQEAAKDAAYAAVVAKYGHRPANFYATFETTSV